MIDPNNKYTKMQEKFYDKSASVMAQTDHNHHNGNPDYWEILLKPLVSDSAQWKDKYALDLGCGTGRNIQNLLNNAYWARVDGVDISYENLKYAEHRILMHFNEDEFKLFKSNGVDLRELQSDFYHFVMSTIMLQHIAVHEIRYSLLEEVYRVLKPGGLISFQMGFGEGYGKAAYYENHYEATETNTKHDVIVVDPDQIKHDLEKIGFKDFTYNIRPAFSDGHPKWIYFNATK